MLALTPQMTWVRVPTTHTSGRGTVLVYTPPPLMLLKGTEQRGECDAKGAGETAYGVVLPRCW
jgi:hypothetical protein